MKKIIRTILVIAILAMSLVGLFACDNGGGESGEKGLIYKKYTGEDFWTIHDYVDTNETSISIPATKDGVKVGRIAAGAFDGCNLKKIVVPTSVEEIGQGAFKNASNLEEIVLPFVGKYFNAFAYENEGALGNATPGDNGYDDVQAVVGERTIWHLFGTEEFDGGLPATGVDSTEFFVPATLSKISILPKANYKLPISAFSGLQSVETIVLDSKVVAIGQSAFAKTIIDTLVIPNTVANIYDRAFEGCDIANLSFASGNTVLKEIGEYAFSTSKIKSIALPEAVETIGEHCFENATSLKSVNLPKTIKTVGYAAFAYCSELTTVSVSGTAEAPVQLTLGSHAFYKCAKFVAFTGEHVELTYDDSVFVDSGYVAD